MTKDEKNRKLAEWLGFQIVPFLGWHIYHRPQCKYPRQSIVTECEELGCSMASPDFFASEEASALLLEKIRRPLYVSDWPDCEGWRVDIGVEKHQGLPLGPTHTDRKTAIAEAALKLIELEAKK